LEKELKMLRRINLLLTSLLFFIISIIATTVLPAQTDTIRVACVGNSITEGTAAGDPTIYGYPAELGKFLGDGWWVKNCGVSGRTMLRNGDFPIWNEQLFKDALAFNPNIVTIMLGTNDSKYFNWDDHKGEFVDDYKDMVDTFRTLSSNPEVYLCLPLPAFSSAYDINDSIITTDIIPMIQQVATDKSCPVIDFYSFMSPHSDLIPDGIHPNAVGLALMAELFYSTLTSNEVIEVKDINTANGRTASGSSTIDQNLDGVDKLVDGDELTLWKTTGLPATAVVDLDSVQTLDLIRVKFGTASRIGYKFLVESSQDSGSWIPVLDRSARTDTAAIVHEKITPVDARYLRLTVSAANYPAGDTVSVAELVALKVNNSSHAPALTAKRIGKSGSNERYTITVHWPDSSTGLLMLHRISSSAGLSAMTGYQTGSTFTSGIESIRTGRIYKYYALTFLNGVKCTSDTLVVDTNPTAVGDPAGTAALFPEQVILEQAYPNPFNASTLISFTLPSRLFVTLKIYDLLGREVSTLVSGQLPAGNHIQQWDALNMPSGLYLYRLQAGNYDLTKKIILLK
jgi:lysophospholipase L1-like esterase